MRSRPLLTLYCKGCDRSNQGPDTYIPEDFLEWASGYYKLTAKMRKEWQRRTSPLCKDCAETLRRGFPTSHKEDMVQRLESDRTFKFGEFEKARMAYIKDVEEKIRCGELRVKILYVSQVSYQSIDGYVRLFSSVFCFSSCLAYCSMFGILRCWNHQNTIKPF